MALTSNITYSGKHSFEFFSAALFDNTILGDFPIFDGVQASLKIPRVTLSGHVVADSCDFSPAGSITLDPVTLSVCSYKVNERICRSEIEPTFLSERLQAGSNNEVAPRDFGTYILNELGGQIGNNMQNAFWNGVAGATTSNPYLNLCDGILTQADEDDTVIDVSGTTVSVANVEAELAKVFLAIPSNVKSSGKRVIIYVSQNVADAYAVAQGQLAYSLDSTTQKVMRYAGIEMRVAPFMPSNTMFATAVDNIAVGVDLMSDMQEVRVIDTNETLGENAWRIVARWKFGAVIKIGAEAVLYS